MQIKSKSNTKSVDNLIWKKKILKEWDKMKELTPPTQ